MTERFIVAVSSGYPMNLDRKGGGNRWVTEYMVQDTANCHCVVWSSLRNRHKVTRGGRGNRQQLFARELADEVCARFNHHGSRLPSRLVRDYEQSDDWLDSANERLTDELHEPKEATP